MAPYSTYCPWVMIWTNLNLHDIRKLSNKFQGFFPQWLLRFLKIFPIYSHIKLWSPIVAPSYPRGHDWNKLESPLYQEAFIWISAFLAQWFLRRFLNDTTLFLHFRDYLPFDGGLVLHLNKLEFNSPKDDLYQVWLNLAQWFWRRRWKCEKFTTPTTTTDNRQILIRKAHLSLQLRWANKTGY